MTVHPGVKRQVTLVIGMQRFVVFHRDLKCLQILLNTVFCFWIKSIPMG